MNFSIINKTCYIDYFFFRELGKKAVVIESIEASYVTCIWDGRMSKSMETSLKLIKYNEEGGLDEST